MKIEINDDERIYLMTLLASEVKVRSDQCCHAVAYGVDGYSDPTLHTAYVLLTKLDDARA